jgi:dihydroneopterin aldolase
MPRKGSTYASMDYIHIEDLKIRSIHGCNDYERVNEQEFVVSIRVGCDMSTAAATDSIAETIDFNFLVNAAKGVFAAKSYFLLEALAEDICTRILSDVRILEVQISIRKTEVLPDAVPGITVTRTK